MEHPANLRSHLLIAMPGLRDPNFAKTVLLICQHDDEGVLGIVVNRASPWRLADIFKQIKLKNTDCAHSEDLVLQGGPVGTERGLILHTGGDAWASTLTVNNQLSLTTSIDILEAIAENRGPEQYLMTLGYAGWNCNQLEDEIRQNSWLHAPLREDILFETPVENRWDVAFQNIGIEPYRLSMDVGNA